MTGLYDGPIVDAHHHLWDYDPATQPWLESPGLEPLRRSFGPADYRAAADGLDVVGTVWIEALAADPLAEARRAQRRHEGRPGICDAIVAHAPLDAPDLERRLDSLQDQVASLRGIRDIVAAAPDRPSLARHPDLLDLPAFSRGLEALARRGLAFDLMLEASQLRAAAHLLGRHPDLTVIVEHAGSPDLDGGAAQAMWLGGLRELAELPNVAIKISALHCRMPDWTDARLAEQILAIVDLFGANRTAFASDYPVHDRTCPLARAYATFRQAVRTLSAADQRALFHDTAARLYRLG